MSKLIHPSNTLNGPKICKFSTIATMSVVLPEVRVNEAALIGAHTLVRTDVPRDSICLGASGKVVGKTKNIKLQDGSAAYPWRRHFHRGYPEHIVNKWKEENYG